jgi:2-dehydro-3-deoxyphosphogluconate aldolase/(4S)-4-hydroxy-2-oxoglutarate aldolase
VTRDQTLQSIGDGRLIAILRGDFGDRIDVIGDTLAEAGVKALEVTMNSPRAFVSIERLARRLATRVAVGVGTVRSPEDVRRAADAGATFVVSPECDRAVIAATRESGLVSLPGCFSPTEIAQAIAAGADAVKLFPAGSLGTAFIHAMRGPSPELRMVPTGGVSLDNAAGWLAAGAWALGVGGELVRPQDDLQQLRRRADAFVGVCGHVGV